MVLPLAVEEAEGELSSEEVEVGGQEDEEAEDEGYLLNHFQLAAVTGVVAGVQVGAELMLAGYPVTRLVVGGRKITIPRTHRQLGIIIGVVAGVLQGPRLG